MGDHLIKWVEVNPLAKNSINLAAALTRKTLSRREGRRHSLESRVGEFVTHLRRQFTEDYRREKVAGLPKECQDLLHTYLWHDIGILNESAHVVKDDHITNIEWTMAEMENLVEQLDSMATKLSLVNGALSQETK